MTKTKKTRNTTNAFVDKSPDWLRSEPVGEAPAPPVGGVRKHGLPFLELEWANFERLCHRLAEQDARVEDAWAYGKSGHAQHGIDILVRLNDGAYEVWQTKRHKTFSPSKLAGAVDFFLAHQWAARAKRFVLAVACDFSSPDTLKAVEDARDKLKAKEVEFEPLDASKLSKRLYNEPELVDLFFDRPWVKRFCSDESQRKVANTLSRFELASTRQRLLDWYRSWALTVDGGLPIAGPDHLGRARPPVPLVKRFIEPDVLVGFVSHDDSLPSSSQETQEGRTSDETTGNIDTEIRVARKSAPIHTLDKRLPVSRLLSTERKVVVAGAAGAGKSTLLRVLAIDLLEESTTLGLSGFADHLPIWIPFAYWANLSKGSTPVGLQAVVRAFFEAHSDIVLADALTRALNSVKVILLVDGLDEASDPVVAKTLAGLLVTFAEHNDLPVIATTRPQGLPFISGQATGWSQSHLAPLSDSQRRSLAHLWFAVLERIGDATLSAASVEQRAAQNAKALISALKRSPGTARLSQTPLFLLALLTLHRDGHVLPRSRFAAAKVMVEQLIEHQPSKRASAALETIAKPVDRLRDRLLDDFAFALHSDHFKGDVPNAASEHDAIDRATVIALERLGGHDREKAEERARSIFHFGEERAGLLVKPIGGNIGFLHLTFQEYLAAKHVFGLPPSHRRRFVCEHAHLQKWREPILYLLFLLNNEHDVSDIVSAIEDVEAKNSQTHAWALLVQAVFSDFAHHPANVRRLAKRFFSEVEMAAWGYRLRHLLSCITDGLLSEAVSDLCHAKIAEWMPDRHGYARAPIVRAVQHWDKAVQPAILDFLKRNLSADRYISRPSSEILVHVTKADPSTKSFFQDLIRTGPSVEAVTAGLYGLACGWPTDADVLETADIARKSIDRRVSIEGIRIRARAMRTTTEDLDTFIKAARFGDHFAGEGLLAPDLLEHFGAVHRGDFIARLEKKYQATRHSRPHELIAIIGALIYCDPSHRYVAEGLKLILEDTWTWDYIFSRGGFPASRVPWQGELLAVVESYVTQKEKHREYELYWIAKVCPTPALKQKILEALRTKQHLSFWSARALVEVWGPTHPETVSAFEELIEGSSNQVEMIAEYLPDVIQDRPRVRAVLLKCLESPHERIDFVLAGLRKIDVAQDEEIFNAAWNARDKLKAGGLYRDLWCAELIHTFPKRPEVRQQALDEIHGHDGRVAAIAGAYGDDPEILLALLRTASPLVDTARFLLVRHLQAIAEVAEEPLSLLAAAREDSDGTVRTEAWLTWTDIVSARSPLPADEVDKLTAELDALGPIYMQRRAAATVALLSIGRFDAVVATVDHKKDPRTYSICQPSYREDDRFLRRVLDHWDEAVNAMGDEQTTLTRLEINPYSALELLEPGMPHSDHLFDILYPAALIDPNVSLHIPLERAALFRPRSELVRNLALSVLLERDIARIPPDRVRDTYRAELSAGTIVAEQFGQDRNIIEALKEECRRNTRSVSAPAALAEILLRHPDVQLKEFILEHSPGRRIDRANYFRILAAVGSPERIVEELAHFLSSNPRDEHVVRLSPPPTMDGREESEEPRHQGERWLASMLRRAQVDAELRAEIWNALRSSSHPSHKTSFALLLKRSGYNQALLYSFIAQTLRSIQAVNCPEIGYDLFAATYRPLRHVYYEVMA